MQVDKQTGRLIGVEYCSSPNQSIRPQGSEINLVVVHAISLPPGQYGGSAINDLFLNQLDITEHPYYLGLKGLQVSAHLLIRREGEIVQYVAFDQQAWHAGLSSYSGCSGCNEYSIGIELEGDDETPFTKAQYQQLNQIIQALYAAYPQLGLQNIVGHCDIAPGRKTDPGPHFDWSQVMPRTKPGIEAW